MKKRYLVLIAGLILFLPSVGAETVSDGSFGGEADIYSAYNIIASGSFNGSVEALYPPPAENVTVSSGSFNGTVDIVEVTPEEPTPPASGNLSWIKKVMIILDEI